MSHPAAAAWGASQAGASCQRNQCQRPWDGPCFLYKGVRWIWSDEMLTGAALWYIGVPIPILILLWFFFFRGR